MVVSMKFITASELILPHRPTHSHKGQNGTVLAVGGSEQYVGAITLAGLAALRSGADIVNIIAPKKVAWAINAYSPDLITTKISGQYFTPKHIAAVKRNIQKYDVLLIGNGIGLGPQSKKFCKRIIASAPKLKVIDADAIKSISFSDAQNSIITPHARELEQFMKNSHISKNVIRTLGTEKNIKKKAKLIQKAAQKFLAKNNIILLKGKIDAIISPHKIYYNNTGNAGMTRGGTGDVLAGLCAGFLAQSKNLLQSALNAAYVNGRIGDILLKKKKWFTYLASDMVQEIEKLR